MVHTKTHPSPIQRFFTAETFHADMLQDYSVLLYGLPDKKQRRVDSEQVWVLTNSDNQDTPRYNKGTLRKTM